MDNRNIKPALENNGMLVYFINSYDPKPLFINRKIYVTLSDEFHQNAFETIRNVRSKVNPYSIVKTEIGFQSYVTKIKNTTKRVEMTKFILCNHNVMIDSGRHKNIPRESRICPFACNCVENEMHFLLFCPTYTTRRSKMIDHVISLRPSFTFY